MINSQDMALGGTPPPKLRPRQNVQYIHERSHLWATPLCINPCGISKHPSTPIWGFIYGESHGGPSSSAVNQPLAAFLCLQLFQQHFPAERCGSFPLRVCPPESVAFLVCKPNSGFSLGCHLTSSKDSRPTDMSQPHEFPARCSKPMWKILNSPIKKWKRYWTDSVGGKPTEKETRGGFASTGGLHLWDVLISMWGFACLVWAFQY